MFPSGDELARWPFMHKYLKPLLINCPVLHSDFTDLSTFLVVSGTFCRKKVKKQTLDLFLELESSMLLMNILLREQVGS